MNRTSYLLATLFLLCTYAKAVNLKPIVQGLDSPLWATSTAAAPNYLYILEKKGKVRIFDTKANKLLSQPFIDISEKIKIKMNEQGLLGMAFCPNFPSSGNFYLNYTNRKGDTHISRFKCNPKNPLLATVNSEQILLTVNQPHRNHNGGWIGFGPDKLLYISMGDGGAAYDPKNKAQDLSSLLGKLLRINVTGNSGYSIPSSNPFIQNPKARPEIYAYGIRNAWRCSWDRATGDFYMADVGQNSREEINYAQKGKGKGANYGWRLREGELQSPKNKIGGVAHPSYTEPIYTYSHGVYFNQGYSITGGFVYRGPVKVLYGKYLFADWANPQVWTIQVKSGKATNYKNWTRELKLREHKIYKISSFAEDHKGEVYIIDYVQGALYKIVN